MGPTEGYWSWGGVFASCVAVVPATMPAAVAVPYGAAAFVTLHVAGLSAALRLPLRKK